MIRPAKLADIPKVMTIAKACADYMISNNIYQWNEHYPSKAAFFNDLKRDELYVLDLDGNVSGAVTVSTHMDEEYIPIEWLTSSKNNIYIHRLCVHPDLQGQGHARRLMGFAERLAEKKGAASVRLDTFSQNRRNQRFYEQRGYRRLGDIFFPKQSEDPFHCYELVLNDD